MDFTREDIQKIYDTDANVYKQNTQNFEFPNGLFEKFQEYINGQKVLDIGCGYGREVQRLKMKGFDAYGIDISAGLLALAQPSIQKFLLQGDIMQLHKYYQAASFDAVISSASVVHMSYTDAGRVFHEASMILKPRGVFFISVKFRDADAPHHSLQESVSVPGVKKPYTYYNYEELSELLIKNNLFPFFHSVYTHREKWMIVFAKK